jgi:hypothetical protein
LIPRNSINKPETITTNIPAILVSVGICSHTTKPITPEAIIDEYERGPITVAFA